jgi:integrase
MPWRDVPSFMAKLRGLDGALPRALEFVILTASRRDEARLAKWDEVDFETATWTVPAERMKKKKKRPEDHRVPLSPRCVEILRDMEATRQNEFVFPGRDDGPLGEKGLGDLLQRLGHSDITTHGFRSSFRTWAAEATAFPHEVCEQALAHTISNAVERAYQRGDLFAKRGRLMQAWSEFCAKPQASGDVVQLRAAADV